MSLALTRETVNQLPRCRKARLITLDAATFQSFFGQLSHARRRRCGKLVDESDDAHPGRLVQIRFTTFPQHPAPSVRGELLPAVSVPRPLVRSKAGFNRASFSMDLSRRGK